MRASRSLALSSTALFALATIGAALPGSFGNLFNYGNGQKQPTVATTDCSKTSGYGGNVDKTKTAVTLTLEMTEKYTTVEQTTTEVLYKTQTHETTIVNVSTQVQVSTEIHVSTQETTKIQTVPTTIPTTVPTTIRTTVPTRIPTTVPTTLERTITATPSSKETPCETTEKPKPTEMSTNCNTTEPAAATTNKWSISYKPLPATVTGTSANATMTDECPCEETPKPTSTPHTTEPCDTTDMGGSPESTANPYATGTGGPSGSTVSPYHMSPFPGAGGGIPSQDTTAPPSSITPQATISIFNICTNVLSNAPCGDTPSTYLGGVMSANASVTVMGVQCLMYSVPVTSTVSGSAQSTMSPMTECLATPIPITEGVSTFIRPGTQHIECDLGTSLWSSAAGASQSAMTMKSNMVVSSTVAGSVVARAAVPTSGAICRLYSASDSEAPATVTVQPSEVRWDVMVVTSGAPMLSSGSSTTSAGTVASSGVNTAAPSPTKKPNAASKDRSTAASISGVMAVLGLIMML